MPRNGSGVFSPPGANYPAVAGTTITAANRNAMDADFATALTNSIAVNGESVITNDIPMSNNKVTGLKTGTVATDATNLGQVQSGASTVLSSVSGTDTITATLSPTLVAYASGQMFKLVPANTNTGAVTININSLGAKAITKNGATALVAGDLVAGVVYILEYDGTQFQAITAGVQSQLTGKADLTGATFTGPVEVPDDALASDWNGSVEVPTKNAIYDMLGLLGSRNRLINPSGAIYQIAVAATADDAYHADGWYSLSQTGTVTPSKLSDPEDGFLNGIRVTQSQASAQRFGFAQIVESVNCKDMRGGSIVLVPRIRASASQAIRYAILGWSGTADAVTSDVVADWTSASYTAGGFFNSTTLSVIAVGSQTPSANTWTSLTALTAAAGSTFNNLIVMVWTEGTAAQNFTLDFDYIQLEKGATFSAFEYRDIDKEIQLCQRYFEKSYDLTTDPATVTSSGAESFIGNANATTGARGQGGIRYKTRKRSAPTITLYAPDTGTSGSVYDQVGASDRASSANIIGETGFTINPSALSIDGRWRTHWVAEARL